MTRIVCCDCGKIVSSNQRLRRKRCDNCIIVHKRNYANKYHKAHPKKHKTRKCLGCDLIIDGGRKRCEQCRIIYKKVYANEYHKINYVPIIRHINCIDCGILFVKTNKKSNRCNNCREEHNRKRDRKYNEKHSRKHALKMRQQINIRMINLISGQLIGN